MFEYRTDSIDLPQATADNLRTYRETLKAIETIASHGETPEELHRLLKYVHCGTISVTPAFEPGLEIFRAVRIDTKPFHRSRLSYPPQRYVTQHGRLNAIGEVLFYGSVGQIGNSLYECRANTGDLFAMGCWRTTRTLVLNQMGYSSKDVDSRAPGRPRQTWINGAPVDGTRDSLLHAWQSEVFTKNVARGEEWQYNLSIALARLALDGIKENEDRNLPKEFAGVLYPSISSKLYGNNVALRPSAVDSSLELSKVLFLKVKEIPEIEYRGREEVSTVEVDIIDHAVPNQRDGSLIWSKESTVLSVKPWPSASS
jgi:hypothetical protein